MDRAYNSVYSGNVDVITSTSWVKDTKSFQAMAPYLSYVENKTPQNRIAYIFATTSNLK